ncbi:MAG: Uma2 family endonuclease [Planctomycetaceae bacterium]|nr:Uma2 family endonuclease [Planctomycetaceae bacterium]
MTAVILDRRLERAMIARRRRLGIDGRDEVWNGVYVMAPEADVEHQEFAFDLAVVFAEAIKRAGLGRCTHGVNISDRKRGWMKNYRVPDAAVFLNGTTAQMCGEFWCGGPDFAVEIVSPRDRTRKKLPFYEKVKTRELLIVDRRPWKLTLFRLIDGKLVDVGQSTLDDSRLLKSQVVPLSFRLVGDPSQPAMEVVHQNGQQQWLVKPIGRPAE